MMLFLLPQEAVPDTASTAGAVFHVVNQFTEFLLEYAIALAAIGALAMAIIEAWKKAFDARTKFHSKRFTSWVRKSLPESTLSRLTAKPTPTDAVADLLQLATGVSRLEAIAAASTLETNKGKLPLLHAFRPTPASAVFALDIERMMGAIQDAGDAALTAPQKFPALYAFMTTGGNREDVDLWYDYAETGLTEIASAATPGAKERQQVKNLTDCAARLRQVMKRKLDSFQLFTSERWASHNQFGANALGFLLMLGVLLWIQSADAKSSLTWPQIIALSLLGGFFAPVAKDLVSGLKKVKSG